jgi:SsrA-binding protein
MARDSKEHATRRIENRKAWHEYHIHDKLETGIVLVGSEVKSLRGGEASLAEAFAQIDARTEELWLWNMDIAPYRHAPADRQHERRRPRKLLAHKREIERLQVQTTQKGMTLIPLALYFNAAGRAKVEIGLASGKGQSDKRQSIRKREADRSIQRALSRKRLG